MRLAGGPTEPYNDALHGDGSQGEPPVSAKETASDQNLRDWIDRAVRFADSLPARAAAQSPGRRKRQR
jgi:hypothetical protein